MVRARARELVRVQGLAQSASVLGVALGLAQALCSAEALGQTEAPLAVLVQTGGRVGWALAHGFGNRMIRWI